MVGFNSINTNVGAQLALQHLGRIGADLHQVQNRVATGLRVARAQDDGASFAIAQGLRSEIKAVAAVNERLAAAQGLVAVTSTALTAISDSLIDVRALLVKLADENVTGEQRRQYSDAVKLQLTEIADMIARSEFNGTSLLRTTSTDIDVIATKSGESITIPAGGELDDALGDLLFWTDTTGASLFPEPGYKQEVYNGDGEHVGYDILMWSPFAPRIIGHHDIDNGSGQVEPVTYEVVGIDGNGDPIVTVHTESTSISDQAMILRTALNERVYLPSGSTAGGVHQLTFGLDQEIDPAVIQPIVAQILQNDGRMEVRDAQGSVVGYQVVVRNTAATDYTYEPNIYFPTSGSVGPVQLVERGVDPHDGTPPLNTPLGNYRRTIPAGGMDVVMVGLDELLPPPTDTGAGQSVDDLRVVDFGTAVRKTDELLNTFGALHRRIESQLEFNSRLIDATEIGLGATVDADMAKESARLQALQVKQQLSLQSLSLANALPELLLPLFR